MILVDFNQISYACILEHLASTKQAEASIEMVRHMMLNTLRSNVKKFKREYGEVVVAYDSQNYWRREYFPNYKANRKKARAKSQFNWASIFTCLETLQAELKKNLMYKVLCVDGCEADDIIGHLAHVYGPMDKILIISGDKDFIQLQVHKNVEQFSPLIKKMIVDKFPQVTLKQQIIRGDTGDGVPNILSPDDVFVSGGRQKPIMEKKLISWLNSPVQDFCANDTMLRNYKRNEKLIDLKEIPVEIKAKIGEAFEAATHPNRNDFMKYLAASGLRELTESVEDF
jgi:hypothetical protein